MKLSVIMPAFNEEKRIEQTLVDYSRYLKKHFESYEIMVICDGTTDMTLEIVKGFAKSEKHIRILEFKERLGKGGAILKGFNVSKGSFVGFVDADDAVQPKEFHKLLLELKTYDCCIASRRLPGSIVAGKRKILRMSASVLFNILVNLMFGLNIKDTQCGAKVFRKKVIDDILKLKMIHGFAFDIDLLLRIKQMNFTIKEKAITWEPRPGSVFKYRDGVKMFFCLIKLKREMSSKKRTENL